MVKLKSMHATPEAVEAAFYEALEAGDVDSLMEVWSDDEEIVCIHPGGPRLVGHRAVAASWREILSNGPITVRPTDPEIMQAALVSVHSSLSRVVAYVRNESEPAGSQSANRAMTINMLVTHVFFKGAQGWRMVLHHASVTPQDTDTMASPSSGTLH
jgi:ketosteroid isomerase-like protein